MRSILPPPSRHALLGIAFALLAGCAGSPGAPPTGAPIEVAFSPDAGSEALVLKVIDSAHMSIRLAGYSFTSPSVVRALIDAKHRGIDVRVLIDDKGNRGKANIAAMNLLVGAHIPTKVISAYAIHHDKYIVVDGKHTQTGSFNYSQAAAKANSENVLVVWGNPKVAATYLAHWENRWAQGIAIEMSY
jgi:phosphatidylserine/phosphatidylglycerophosphate/cardiolipin synthase-like enzyme